MAKCLVGHRVRCTTDPAQNQPVRSGALRAKHLKEGQEDIIVHPRNSAVFVSLSAAPLALTGCQAIQGIFKAGFWLGAFGVAAMAVLVFLTLSLVRR